MSIAEKAMRFVQGANRRLGIAGELLIFLWGNKRWWTVLMILVLLFFGVLLILAESSAVAPFIYTLFQEPAMWKRAWEAWKRLARHIGNFQARVLLTVVYMLLMLHFGAVIRCMADPLRIKQRPDSRLDHPNGPSPFGWARRQWARFSS